MRKEVIGDCVLYRGDCLEIMPTLGECADMVLTDPPYLLTSGRNGDYANWHLAHDYDNSGKIVECDIDWPDFMKPIYESMRGDSHCYTMCNNRHVKNMLNAAEQAGFRFHNLLAWDKMSCTPNRWYMKNIEFVGFFYKGKAKFINNCSNQQSMACPQENYGGHPTTKPTPLMAYYIKNSSQPGETVLDPFMGVASTGVGCIKANRKFIGIELDEKYFDIACKRIEEAYCQPDMFIEPPIKYTQEKLV